MHSACHGLQGLALQKVGAQRSTLTTWCTNTEPRLALQSHASLERIIPTGNGLGASSATILKMNYEIGTMKRFTINLELSRETQYDNAINIKPVDTS